MKKILFIAILTLIGIHTATAQVGIGTETPKTTLQIIGAPETITLADGLQVPVLNTAQLNAKSEAYGNEQNGAIIYNDGSSAQVGTGKAVNVTSIGFYYYNSSQIKWVRVGITNELIDQIELNLKASEENAVDIADLFTGQDDQDAAIALNTDKVGITTEQISQLEDNTVDIEDLYSKNSDNATQIELNLKASSSATAFRILAVGDTYGGGKIAYILVSGDSGYDANTPHGLIAATSDHSVQVRWHNVRDVRTGAQGTAIGTGLSNTNTIISIQGTTTTYAARVCADYSITVNGIKYSDWYLPSIDELYKLYRNKTAIGGFVSQSYWSSSEKNDGFAIELNFNNGSGGDARKDTNNKYVRAIRAF